MSGGPTKSRGAPAIASARHLTRRQNWQFEDFAVYLRPPGEWIRRLCIKYHIRASSLSHFEPISPVETVILRSNLPSCRFHASRILALGHVHVKSPSAVRMGNIIMLATLNHDFQ